MRGDYPRVQHHIELPAHSVPFLLQLSSNGSYIRKTKMSEKRKSSRPSTKQISRTARRGQNVGSSAMATAEITQQVVLWSVDNSSSKRYIKTPSVTFQPNDFFASYRSSNIPNFSLIDIARTTETAHINEIERVVSIIVIAQNASPFQHAQSLQNISLSTFQTVDIRRTSTEKARQRLRLS